MKRFTIILLPVLMIALAGLNSCKSCNRSDSSIKLAGDQKQIELDSLDMEIEKAVYPLPTSAEIIKMLTELEVGYMIGISNPVDNVKKYLTSKVKAINMGIYGADLSYATLYNMNQEVDYYLKAIRTLANDLNMGSLYNERVYNQIKESFDDRDNLVEVLKTAFNGTYNYLSKNDQETLALMVVAGAWVEGMYITTHISESVYHVEGIASVLLEQKKSFESFYEISKPFKDDPMVKEILDLFEPMRILYEGLDTGLTLKNVEDITSNIEEIRDKLVS